MGESRARTGATVAVYVAILVVALGGIAFMLRLGERLEAPAAIGGSWRLETRPALTESCIGLVPRGASRISITQSGVLVGMAFDDPTMPAIDGRFEKGILRARSPRGRVEIAIVRAADWGSLEITWRSPRPECAGVFRAVREQSH